MLKILSIAALLFLVAYVAILGFVYVSQRSLLYPAGGEMRAPHAVGLPEVEELFLDTSDGERLAAWYHPPLPGEHTILYLQGNAETFAQREVPFRTYIDAGYGLLAISYRGFAGSTGEPSQDGLITDAVAAYDWLSNRDQKVVLHGQSLGSGVAVQLASRKPVDALVLEVPFTAAVDVAASVYPFLPVRFLMQDQWRSGDIIGNIDAPILIAGAEFDAVVPVEQSRELFELASDPKRYALVANAGHVSTWENGLWEDIGPFLNDVLDK